MILCAYMILPYCFKRAPRALADRVASNLGPTGRSRATAFSSKSDPPRLLALSPNVDLRRTRSLEEYSRVVAGLMQVGCLRLSC